MANTLTFEQASTLLNTIAGQVTGKTAMAPVNTAEFVTVANTTLQCGYNAVMDAISQVLNRTIFSIRPYYRKFDKLKKSSEVWGDHTRKINYLDGTWVNDDNVPLTDGTSLDHYTISKPSVLQTNFYGGIRYSRFITIFTDELRTAFKGPEELSQFWSGVVTNLTDQIEQGHDNVARLALANFIGGKVTADTKNVVHLLTEYNNLTGQTLTNKTVFAPNNFKPFIQWMLSRIASIMDLMTERGIQYHMNVTGSEISRHTPLDLQRVYILSKFANMIDSMAVSDTFNERYMRRPDWQPVNFWQAPEAPDTIQVTPSYMGTDGTVKTASKALDQSSIVGVLFDDEAIGYTTFNEQVISTPVNARGSYYNMWYHWRDRYWNDFTENGIVLLLD